MSDKIMFRKSFNGYNTQDVNNYIIEFNNRFKKNDEEKDKIIEELKSKIKELEESTVSHEKTEEIPSDISEKIASLESENEELKNKIKELEAKGTADQSVIEKSNNYDKVSEQIGAMIMDAGAKAETIVSDAKIKAQSQCDEMVNNTQKDLVELNAKYILKIREETENLASQLRLIANKAEEFEEETRNAIKNECENIGKTEIDESVGGNTNE